MIKFTEIRRKVSGVDGQENQSDYILSEVWLNQHFVVNVREEPRYHQLLREGHLPTDLDAAHRFTAITTNSGDLTKTYIVVGDPNTIARRLQQDTKGLLKG